MILDEPFQINSRHWIYALLFALFIHLAFFLAYYPSQKSGGENFNQKSLIINLKKITSPPNVKSSPIVQPRVEPIPEPKLEPKLKPIEKPKPIVKTKPSAIVKPVEIHQPKIEPLQYDQSVNVNVVSSQNDLSIKQTYEFQLLEWLGRYKKYPDLARRRGQQGTVILEFAINTEGKLLSYKIIQPSDYSSLNTAVERMIKHASPLPPIPTEIRNDRDKFSYTVPIHFVLKKSK